MHVGTSLVQIVHPQGFDLWTSENHWVSFYPSNTPVLKLILPSFVVDVLIWFFDVCSLIWRGVPPCSSNFTSGLARRNISHSGRQTFSAVSSECKLCFPIVLLPICLSRHVFTIPTRYFDMRQQHVVLLLCFLLTTYSLAVQNWFIEFQQSPCKPIPGSAVLLGLIAIGWMMNGAVDVLGWRLTYCHKEQEKIGDGYVWEAGCFFSSLEFQSRAIAHCQITTINLILCYGLWMRRETKRKL